MKKPGLLLILLCSAMMAISQAKPSYTQYILNNYILNPALTGIENYVDVKLSIRNQWTGINGAPVTNYLSIQGPIGKQDLRTSATSFAPPANETPNPRGPEYWAQYTTAAPHHGLGLTVVNDKAGYINRWSVAANYAYHKPLGVKTTLAAGFSLGVSSVNVDRSKIYLGNLNPQDDAIGYTTGELKKVKPEIGAGLWLYSARYFVGVSVLNIVPAKAKYSDNDKYGTYYTPNYFFTAGYRIAIDEQVSLLPSFMIQYWQPQLTGVHVNAKFQYEDKVWLGGGYRFSNTISGYSGMAGVNISNTFNISYSYEVATTNRLRAYTGNTHEIVLGFLIGNKAGDTCPRNIW